MSRTGLRVLGYVLERLKIALLCFTRFLTLRVLVYVLGDLNVLGVYVLGYVLDKDRRIAGPFFYLKNIRKFIKRRL